ASVSTFHTGPTLALPTSLGALTVGAPRVGSLDVWTTSGTCTAPITAVQASIDLSFSPDATPWQEALVVETLVDGQPWRFSGDLDGAALLGGTRHTVVYTMCASTDDRADKGLAAGSHSVSMRATLAGSTVSVETTPMVVTLQCPDTDGGGGGTG